MMLNTVSAKRYHAYLAFMYTEYGGNVYEVADAFGAQGLPMNKTFHGSQLVATQSFERSGSNSAVTFYAPVYMVDMMLPSYILFNRNETVCL